MGAVTNLVINDGLPTPVAHTFVPLGPDANGVWWFEDQSPTATIAYKRISLSLTRPATAKPGEMSDNRMNRVRIRIYDPVADNITNSTVSGVLPSPSLAYITSADCTFILPERSTIQNREDIRVYVAQILTLANVVEMIEQLRNIY
jgi:hypothetical protein